jgi:hypothetical protein
MIRGLQLNLYVAVLNLTVVSVREDQDIGAIVMYDSLGGEPATQDVPLHVVDAQIRDHMLARS